jgi:hypothetical protein
VDGCGGARRCSQQSDYHNMHADSATAPPNQNGAADPVVGHPPHLWHRDDFVHRQEGGAAGVDRFLVERPGGFEGRVVFVPGADYVNRVAVLVIAGGVDETWVFGWELEIRVGWGGGWRYVCDDKGQIKLLKAGTCAVCQSLQAEFDRKRPSFLLTCSMRAAPWCGPTGMSGS